MFLTRFVFFPTFQCFVWQDLGIEWPAPSVCFIKFCFRRVPPVQDLRHKWHLEWRHFPRRRFIRSVCDKFVRICVTNVAPQSLSTPCVYAKTRPAGHSDRIDALGFNFRDWGRGNEMLYWQKPLCRHCLGLEPYGNARQSHFLRSVCIHKTGVPRAQVWNSNGRTLSPTWPLSSVSFTGVSMTGESTPSHRKGGCFKWSTLLRPSR